MSLSFDSIAKKKVEDVERPPLPPRGTYRFRVTKVPSISKSKDGKWEIVSFPMQAVEAVDADMDDYSGAVTGIQQFLSFMFDTEDEVSFGKTEYRLRQFLETHLQVVEDGFTLTQAMNAAVGAECLADITWREQKNNPGEMDANIGKTAPLD